MTFNLSIFQFFPTSDTYFSNNPTSLLTSVFSSLKNFNNQADITDEGTDLYMITRGGTPSAFDEYSSLDAENKVAKTYYVNCYGTINYANGYLHYTEGKDGYYPIDGTYDNGSAIADASQCVDIYAKVTTIAALTEAGTNVTNTWGTTWTSAGGNALGVIAFPVYAEAGVYYVNATGSKLTANGFVFVPGATEIGKISFSKAGSESGINAIESAAAADGKAYNVSGQEVDNSFKGIVVKNGKKYVQK